MGNRGGRKIINMCCFVHNIQELIQSNSGSTAKIEHQSTQCEIHYKVEKKRSIVVQSEYMYFCQKGVPLRNQEMWITAHLFLHKLLHL